MEAVASSGSKQAGAAPGVVAVASSAGGIAALTVVLSGLDDVFPAALVIVQHLDPHHVSHMPELLARQTSMNVTHARHGTRMSAGCAYVAPPDRHVLVADDGTLALSAAERVQWVRPSANVLFDSVARVFGARAAAVVLSGTGRDGADGCVSIHNHGGRVIVQDEASSQFAGMPRAAALTGDADVVLPLLGIAHELKRWAALLQTT